MRAPDDVVDEFLVESQEHLDRFDRDLLALEQDPAAVEPLASMFRAIHTVKGTSAALGFVTLAAVAHAAEGLLGGLRDGELAVSGEVATALLATGDALRATLATIEADGSEGPDDHRGLVATLAGLHSGRGGSVVRPLGQILVERGHVDAGAVVVAIHEQRLGDGRPLGEILVDRGSVAPHHVEEALAEQAGAGGRHRPEDTVRLRVGLLEDLSRLVEELETVRDDVAGRAGTLQDGATGDALARLDHVTARLQQAVRRARMQPLAAVTSRLPRTVRDLGAACGKDVRLTLEGQGIELDRTVLEAIRDPLVHLVRNAVDHGIEPARDRAAAGKPREGRVVVRAFEDVGHLQLDVSDDGRGIRGAEVVGKALDRSLVSREQAGRLPEGDAVRLVFLPGLSTADDVSSVSGRGVGLDVVRTNVEGVGGTVEVRSAWGQGTTFTIRVPVPPADPSAGPVRQAGP